MAVPSAEGLASYAAWRRWRGLGANDRRETLLAALLVPLCAVGVRLVGLQRTRRWLTRGRTTSSSAATRTIAIERAVRSIERVRCHSILPGTCLSRSLALERLLHRCGIASELRIGVRRAQGGLDAHAWVECEGVVLNDTPDVEREYAPFRR